MNRPPAPDLAFDGFEEQRRIARRRRKRVLLPIIIVCAMLAALVTIALYNYRMMRGDALALSKGVIVNLQSRIETEMNAFLGHIPGLARLSRDLFANVPSDGPPRALAEAQGIGMLNGNPQLTAFFVGTESGQFLMVRRFAKDGQSGLETKIIHQATSPKEGWEIELTRRDGSGEVLSRETQPWDNYDPRQRPWYIGASAQSTVYWTDVYPFFTGRTAGVTASMALRDDAGTVRAVVGVDVALDSISRFLATLTIGKSGVALIVDDEGRLISHPSATAVREADDGSLRLTRVSDLDDDAIQRAFDRYRVEGHGRRDFTLGGRRYITSITSLNHLLNRDWSILVVVPEDDFVGFVGDNIRKTLFMGLSVIALAALLAALFVRQGLRDDRAAMRILERQEELDAQGETFGRLATIDRVEVGSADGTAIAEIIESVAHATRARRVSLWRYDNGVQALSCIDCFDRDSSGHTQGNRFDIADHEALMNAVRHGESFALIDTSADPRTQSIYRHYLLPVGCNALLSAPIVVGDEVRGAIWLEDTVSRTAWPSSMTGFVRSIANLLALRSTVFATPTDESASADDAQHVMPRPASTNMRATLAVGGLDASLDRRRAAALSARLAARGTATTSPVEVLERQPIIVILFTDAAALAGIAATGNTESTMAYILNRLEAAAATSGIAYLKVLGSQIVGSVEPDETAQQGLIRIIDFALSAHAICDDALPTDAAAPVFRIGVDSGPAIAGLVGHDEPSLTLWGDAVQTAALMAETALPGTIQVTESVYQALRSHYLFQLRGHHYAEAVGEFASYLVEGRL